MKIAIVGSGIAGLSAAWLLGEHHDVTLFDALPEPGMGAHALALPGCELRADVPLRVFYEGYYPHLLALYRQAGVETKRVDYSTSFCDRDGQTYYRYHNQRLGLATLWAFLGPQAFRATSRKISRDLLRYYLQAPRDYHRERNRRSRGEGPETPETIAEYVARRCFSPEFVELFLLPAYAGVGTVSYAQVKQYPAGVLNEYMARGLFFTGVLTTAQGTDDVVGRLTSRVQAGRYGHPVEGVALDEGEGQVEVRCGGETERFDHVVVATQANHAQRFLAASAEEQEFLASFRYTPSEVVMHTDAAVMPSERRDWSPVNFMVPRQGESRRDPAYPMPMATIWASRLQPELPADVLQTWNPIVEIAEDRVLARARFERPAVDEGNLRALARLEELHDQPGRRIWFCGSYARRGIPLLESGVASALAVARRLGVVAEWAPAAEAAARSA